MIIAQGFSGPDARAQATRLAAALVGARGPARVAGAYAKPCTPLSPPALPVPSAVQLPPLPELPTTTLTLDAKLAEGCQAWSPGDRAALCVLGAFGDSLNFWDLRFLALDPEKKVPEELALLDQPDPSHRVARPPLSGLSAA